MDASQIMELSTLLLAGAATLGTVAWRIIVYINKVDEKRSKNTAELHKKIDDTASSLDGKFTTAMSTISKLKDDTVRRDDLLLHLARIERGQEATTIAIDRLRDQMNAGLLKIVERANGAGDD